MLAISKILVPVDFSSRCLGVIPYVEVVARRYGAEVILLHVVKPVYAFPETGISDPGLMTVPQWAFEERVKQLECFGAKELDGIPVRRLVYEGVPEEQIVALSDAEDVHLVIMPTHGHGIFRRFLIGSITAKVLHDVICPVLTGAHLETHDRKDEVTISKITCAIDLGPKSRRVLDWTAKLASDLQAQLSIVHAIPPLSPGLELTFSSNVEKELRNMAHRDIERLRCSMAANAVSVHIEEGPVGKAVSSFLESYGSDLVVIGRGARTGESGALKSNAYAIIRQAPCPVLSI